MIQINSYLTFNGNCREAMQFYQSCLGGELLLQTVGESPLSEQLPQEMKDCIVHSTLKRDGVILMGTDMVGEKGLLPGNTVSLLLQCSSETEIRDCYSRLSDGGKATHPLHVSFWGALFGDLTDRYGNNWLLHFENRKS